MRKDEDNALAIVIQSVSRAWWHRKGYEPIGQVLETFTALGYETKTGQKPVLSHHHRIPTGWHLSFTLPPGISSADVVAKIDHFREQTDSYITMKAKGAQLHMEVHSTPMPQRVPFSWDPEPYEGYALPLPIGNTAAGSVVVDLAKLPHLFTAGTTGGGKTTFLRSAAIALLHRPILLVVIDLKGLDFAFLSSHALVVDTAEGASLALRALNKEMDRRRDILKKAGATKLQEYAGNDLPWIVCIVDELGELTETEDQDALNRLARLARATGISLIAATQRPSHTLFKHFTDTRMLFSGRLCFAVPKPEDSRLILDSESACHLPADIPGRAVWRWSEEVELQCPDLSIKEAKKILTQLTPMEVNIIERCATRLLPR